MHVFQNIIKLTILISVISWKANAVTPPHTHGLLKINCDLCSCTTSSGSFGFSGLSTLHFIGLRYVYQTFESVNGIYKNSPKSSEVFNTYQLWGKFPIYKSFYVTTIIPYQNLNRTFNQKTETLTGLGDATLMGWYKFTFLKKTKNSNEVDFNAQKKRSGHSLHIGAGVKLPTGKFEQRLTDKVNPGFQVGTGSLDYTFSLQYNYAEKVFGTSFSGTYYYKTENKNEYRFGNQFSYSGKAFYNVFAKQVVFRPFVSISGDVFDTITQYNETLRNTNGFVVNSSFGVETNYKKWVVGCNYTSPLQQKLLNDKVFSKQQLALYINYNL